MTTVDPRLITGTDWPRSLLRDNRPLPKELIVIRPANSPLTRTCRVVPRNLRRFSASTWNSRSPPLSLYFALALAGANCGAGVSVIRHSTALALCALKKSAVANETMERTSLFILPRNKNRTAPAVDQGPQDLFCRSLLQLVTFSRQTSPGRASAFPRAQRPPCAWRPTTDGRKDLRAGQSGRRRIGPSPACVPWRPRPAPS